MRREVKKFSPAAFGFAAFCFLLPFVTFSCPGAQASYSGVQVMLGTTIEEPTLFGEPKKKRLDGEPLAQLAFLCALGGLVLAFLRAMKEGATGTLVASGAGTALLLALKSKIEGDVLSEGEGMIQVSFELGFWLALLAFLAAAAASVYLLIGKDAEVRETPTLVEGVGPPDAGHGSS